MRSYVTEIGLLIPTGMLDVVSTMYILSYNPNLIPYERFIVPRLAFENFGLGWAPFVKTISTIAIIISMEELRKNLEPENPRFTSWTLGILNAANIFAAVSNFLQI